MENKTGKYFKYAIGEIVLVVIGILIALQINNWNEVRKNNSKLQKILIALKSDLENDLKTLDHHYKYSKLEFNSANEMLALARKESATLDTLIYIGKNKFRPIWVTPFINNTSTFESITYSGDFELLSDLLKSAVAKLYNRQTYYSNNLKTYNEEFKTRYRIYSQTYISSPTDLKPYLAKNLSWKSINKKDFAIQFDGLLDFRKELWEYYLEILEKQKSRTKKLISLINSDLEK